MIPLPPAPRSLRTYVGQIGLCLSLLLLAPAVPAAAQPAAPDTVRLWPDGAPGAVGTAPADRPTLTVHRPPAERATGTGVVICPGGGYTALATNKEGHEVAQWFNSLGITAFVLKYRLGPRYHHPAQIRDAQRALRHVRAEAEAYGIAPNRLGIMGFSAGGHLAATTATLFDRSFGAPQDSLRAYSARPDLLILAYPVISLTDTFTHEGSRQNLLGDDPGPERLQLLSPDQQVSARTPPTFLFSTDADTGVPPENSVAFYRALRDADVPAELHVYERGPHGVGMAAGDYALSSWMDRLADWLVLHGWLDRPPHSRPTPDSPESP